jgi:signal transduction histidine kinase
MPGRLRWTAWSLAVLAVSLSLVSELIGFLWQPTVLPSGMWPPIYDVALPLFTWSFALVGGLIVSRHGKNVIGWVCLTIALVASTYALIVRYSLVAEFNTSASLPAGLWTTWVVQWGWIPLDSLLFVALPALFPTGRLPSRRWRVIIWLAIPAAGVTMGAAALYPVMSLWTAGPSCVWSNAIPGPCYRFSNPFPVTLSTSLLDVVFRLSGGLQSVTILVATLSLVARYRKGSQEIRAQLKWLTLAGSVLFLSSASLFVLGTMLHLTVPAVWLIVIATIILLPFAIAIAILKQRLYDIDIVINKTLLFGAMAAFITLVYVAIVVGLGRLAGTSGRPNLALSILATAIVAVAFQPIRERLQYVANRLVYGNRATPYEFIADFSEQMAGAPSVEDVLPKMAEAAATGVGASQGSVRLILPDGKQRVATWPDDPSQGRMDLVVPVTYRGDGIGEIAIAKTTGEPLLPAERKLLTDLAAQAGLVLHNVRLALELQHRLDEISSQATAIRASRQRIVAAQDTERRRLEETIHGGAEVQLVGIKADLKRVENILISDSGSAAGLLDQLTARANDTLEDLRDLARGIYPPLLRERGLAAALQAQVTKMQAPVQISTDGLGRYAPEAEGAIYFVCLEAIRSATGRAAIHLAAAPGSVEFRIQASTLGLDGRQQDIEDRIQALGGSVAVHHGELSGRLPVRMLEPVQ